MALSMLALAVTTATRPGQAGDAQASPTSPEPAAPQQADLASTSHVEPITAPQLVALPPIVEVDPPTLVEIPIDLVATPTPTSADQGSLPILADIPTLPRDGGVVYLTFDDGPSPTYTNQILDVLARYGAKATFFVLGSSVDANPGTAQRIAAEGHTLGNHTYYHEAVPRESSEHVAQTLIATNDAIVRATGRPSVCFRPPYGSLDQRTFDIVSQAGLRVSMWEVDSRDWTTTDSYAIAASVLRDIELGDRVLFHDGPSNRAATVAAVESVVSVLSARGVQFAALPC